MSPCRRPTSPGCASGASSPATASAAGPSTSDLPWPSMALFHRATITPSKPELNTDWCPTQPWGPPSADGMEVIGSFRFDDPEVRVGMEPHLVSAAGADRAVLPFHLPCRDDPPAGAEDALITEMQHSVLGTRWVYDGLRDPRLVLMLVSVAMTRQGEVLGMVVVDVRWYVAPPNVRI